jgi:hypothetical protein
MTQLVEFKETQYNSGLTANEKAFITSLESPRICDITLSIFKQSIAYGIVLYGIKNLPSDEETNLLYVTMQTHYPYLTTGEMALAFQLNAVGQEWQRIESFNMMSVAFLSDILKSYNDFKMKTNLAIDKKKAKIELPSNTTDEPVDWTDTFNEDIRLWRENKRDFVLMLAPMKVRTFYDKKVIRDEMWPDEDWKKWQFMAYKKTLDAQSISAYKAKRLDKLSRQKFKDDYQCELSRLIYSDIMDSHILQQKIKDGL